MRIFSDGGGVQSTAVKVLQAQGKLPQPYDYFIFANTGEDSENPATLDYYMNVFMPYAHDHGLNEIMLKHVVKGEVRTLYSHLIADNHTIALPMRLSTGVPGSRVCTSDWKIGVISKWLKGMGASAANPATVGLGISVDEFHRARIADKDGVIRDPRSPWEVLEYPLIDMRLTRRDCMKIISDAGLPVPEKSSCWFCPFKRTREWEDMRRTQPDMFKRACELEERINQKRNAFGKDIVRFHRSMKPLAQAIREGQMSWEDDYEMCESGYCHV